jgi:hypothetical protein
MSTLSRDSAEFGCVYCNHTCDNVLKQHKHLSICQARPPSPTPPKPALSFPPHLKRECYVDQKLAGRRQRRSVKALRMFACDFCSYKHASKWSVQRHQTVGGIIWNPPSNEYLYRRVKVVRSICRLNQSDSRATIAVKRHTEVTS